MSTSLELLSVLALGHKALEALAPSHCSYSDAACSTGMILRHSLFIKLEH